MQGVCRCSHVGMEAGELPDLGRQRVKLVAVSEIQGVEAGELPNLGRQRSKLGAVEI